MTDRYNDINQAVSIEYNRCLEQGDYNMALDCLKLLEDIADREGRPHDRNRLVTISVGIKRAQLKLRSHIK